MKKSLLLGLSIGIGLSSFAQQQTLVQGLKLVKVSPDKNVAMPYNKKMISGDETIDQKPLNQRPANPVQWSSHNRASNEVIIGSTTYDLQSNSAVQNRIYNHGGGKISAVWTYSNSGDISAPDRGTGYNYSSDGGASWNTAPTDRVEPSRNGWPSIDKLGGGKEIVTVHNTSLGQLMLSQNGGPGSSSWQSNPFTTSDIVWNRMGVGGPNGNTVHVVGIKDPALSAGGGTPYQGVINALVYYRSLDGGTTWDVQDMVIPGLDSTNYATMSGDSYSIQVQGNTVAVVYYGGINPTVLAKSTDNGVTWTATKVLDFGFKYDSNSSNTTGTVIGISDANGDGIADTLSSTDGAGAILIDGNGMVHVTYGAMDLLDVTEGDGSSSYFPGTNGLMYWNEGMGTKAPVLIGQALDLDGDGILGANAPDFGGGAFTGANYANSLSNMPYMALGANGDVYVSYSSFMETLNQGTQSYRHIYITKSPDGGCSWTMPLDVTPFTADQGYAECVFGSMAKDVDTDIHLVYQKDLEPGLAVRGDSDPYDGNDIIYAKIPVSDIDAQAFAFCYSGIETPAFTAICTGDSVQLQATCGTAYEWSNGSTADMIWATNITTYSVMVTTQCGTVDTNEVTLTDASGMGAPTVMLSATDMKICNGDSTWVSVDAVTGGTYLWDNAATTATTAYDSVGTYMVTVTNCGGSTTGAITITLPNTPTAAISGNNTVCLANDSVMLSAAFEPSATYAWSNGDTTMTTYVSVASTMTMTVTNCAGSDNDSFTISNTPMPTAAIAVAGDNSCEGQTVTLTASGGDFFTWSNSATSTTVELTLASESGSYTVTVANVCGDTDAATASVTINPTPALPVVSSTPNTDGTITYTSTAANNKWYVNGSLVSTGADYSADWTLLKGATVTAVAVDATTGCESASSAGVVAVSTGINDISELVNIFSVYPNPNNGTFTVAFEQTGNYNVTVRNVIGQTVYTDVINGNVANINISNVDKGVYFININGDNFETTQKVVIK